MAEATLKTQGEECFHLEACFPEENRCSEIVSEAILRLTAERRLWKVSTGRR